MFKGWVRTSLIDYPEHIAAVLFTGGCDFRCPMCHNASIVLEPGKYKSVDQDEILDFLEKRQGMLDGVVISGGEPTLHPGLPHWMRKMRALDLHIKLDTSGHHPQVLRDLLDEGLLDYIAMDIKAPREKYTKLSGQPDVNLGHIQQSIDMIRASGLPYEFRTTVVPGLLVEEDILAIAEWISGSQHYILQQFRSLQTLDPSLEMLSPYPVVYLEQIQEKIRGKIERVSLRGV